MKFEIEKHWDKLKRISKFSDKELKESCGLIFKKITFINEELVPLKTWLFSEKLVKDIDEDDMDFIALSIHIKGYLWTGDKVLYHGLKSKNFKRILLTDDLIKIKNLE